MTTIELICTIAGAAVAIALAISGWMSHLFKKHEKKGADDHRLTTVENKMKELPCSQHKNDIDNQRIAIGNLDVGFKKISLDLEYLGKSVAEMSTTLASIASVTAGAKKSMKPATQSQSPIALTDRGRALVAELGIDRMVNSKWGAIAAIIAEKVASRKNPYDIAQTCMEEILLFPEKFLTEEEINVLKLRAYQDGDLLQSFLRIVAVLVRDRYFKEHGISIAKIDAQAPKQAQES